MTDFGSANIQGALHVAVPLGRKKPIKKEARTLYVNRPVLNAMDIIAWAKANGFAKTVTPDDMHVTVAFSRQPVEWIYPSPDKEISFIPENPSLARFGPDGACIVLQFNCGALADRWQHFIDSGASWDWPDYCPHITLTYSGDSTTDLKQIEPYTGQIVLGPEEFDEVSEGWGDDVVEKIGWTDAAREASLAARRAGAPVGQNEHRSVYMKSVNAKGLKYPPENADYYVRDYCINGVAINTALRKGQKPPRTRSVSTLDGLFKNTSLAKDITSYRLLDKNTYDKLTKKIGSTVSDKAFVSTTTTPDRLFNSLKDHPEIQDKLRVVTVDIPKGSKALPVAHFSNTPRDNEVLIARGSKFKVTGSKNKLTLKVL